MHGVTFMMIDGYKVSRVEVARLLGVHPVTVSRMVKAGRIPLIVSAYFGLLAKLKELK